MTSTRATGILCLLTVLAAGRPAAEAQTLVASVESMKKMSLDELLSLEVTTMSRREEQWWSAPGAISVITGEEIRRSTAMNLPEALQLATGVDVAQPSERTWAISTRGFNVIAASKMSVLLDGRSLYTPFFSGVQWNAVDTMLEDVDRIEVVRGPVGALWGSFAVNGFIQIVTKPADETQGLLASGGAGTEDPGFLSLRYGGKVGAHTFFRVYGKYFKSDWTYLPNGDHAEPPTDFGQAGFRMDALVRPDFTLTLQGDIYTNSDLPADRLQTEVAGRNLLAHAHRSFSTDSDLDVLTYYDFTHQLIPGTWEEDRNTGQLNVKYHRNAGRNDMLFGLDSMVSHDDIAHLSIISMEPPRSTTHNVGLYVQDTIAAVPERFAVTLGAKGEHNSFSGFEFEPSIRSAWTPNDRTTVWGAVSRAVRAPVRIDQDLVIATGGTVLFHGNDDFQSEKLIAYELGWRQELADTLTLDVATFVNDYSDLRSTEPAGATPLPLTFRNELRARSAGAETTVMYQPIAPLFFKLSYRYLDLDFSKEPGSVDTTNGYNEGDDPRHLFSLSAHATLPHDLEFDATLRYVSARPNPATDAYTVVDLRLGWSPASNWDIALLGRNLFDGLHHEIITTNSLNEEIGPSGTLKITWKY
ncbi:MAG TPA: TonB-dependent receptor [Opitutus sp.]|nr:TonB-dependent receptor [Opitutus sp.]